MIQRPSIGAREMADSETISLNKRASKARGEGNYTTARSLYTESLRLARELGDKQGIASSLGNLGSVSYMQGDYATALSLYEEGLALSHELGDRQGIALAVVRLGILAYMQGDYLTARSQYDQALVLMRELDDRWGIAVSLSNLGSTAYMLRDYSAAHSLHLESLQIMRELGNKRGIALGLAGLAEVAIENGQAQEGARLLGAVDALFESFGGVIEPDDRIPYDRAVASARSQMGEEAFERARQEGRAMSMEQAIAYVLE